jgi:hypothetical protein
MPDSKTYKGGCHCGAVRYEATTDLKQVISCNCSICMKRGLLLTFVGTEQFALLSGQEKLADYQFGRKAIHHLFCSACGVGSFARGIAPNGAEMVAINVRCLDDVDITALTPTPVDGKNL